MAAMREGSDGSLRADARRNRRQVLDAAVALLADRPQATMQEIADASGLGRTTVYRHFPRRQDLVEALFADVLREAGQTIDEALHEPGSPHELLCALGPRLIAIGDRYRFLEAHPDMRERAMTVGGEIGNPLASFLAEAQARGELRDDLPVAWMLTTLRGLAVVAMYELTAGRITVEEAGSFVGETVAAAFAPEHGRRRGK
jgi:AcrR family transcriptional regulator